MYNYENLSPGISKEGFIGIIIFIILGGLLDILFILRYNKKYQEVKKEEKDLVLEKFPGLSKKDFIYRRLISESYLKIYSGKTGLPGKKQKINKSIAILAGSIAMSCLILNNIPGTCFFLTLCFFFGLKMLLVAPEEEQLQDFWGEYLDKNPDNFLKVVLPSDELLMKYNQLKKLWKGSNLYHLLYSIMTMVAIGVLSIVFITSQTIFSTNLQEPMIPASTVKSENLEVVADLMLSVLFVIVIAIIILGRKYKKIIKDLNVITNQELDTQFPSLSDKDKEFRAANISIYFSVYNNFKRRHGINRTYGLWIVIISLGFGLGFSFSEERLMGLIFFLFAIAYELFYYSTAISTSYKYADSFKKEYLKKHPDNALLILTSSEDIRKETREIHKKMQSLANVLFGLSIILFSVVALTLIFILVVNFLG